MTKIIVGEKVKNLRESKKISVEELAERTGLSTEIINYIESEKELPSMAPLIKISRGLGVRLGTFLDDTEELGPVISRANQRTSSINVSRGSLDCPTGLKYYALAQEKAGRRMEPFMIELEPEKGEHKLSAHEGEEFIYVLEGTLSVDYGKDKMQLNAGDSIYFDSIVKHHIYAEGQTAKILAVLYTPA